MKADSHRFRPRIGELITEETEQFDGVSGSFEDDLKSGAAPLKVVWMLSLFSLAELTSQTQPHPIMALACA